MNFKNVLRLGVAGLMACMVAVPAVAMTDEEAGDKGFEIAARSDRSDRGFTDSHVSSRMILRNAQGQETTRGLRQKIKEIPDEGVGDKSIMIFDTPRDVKGTAFLSHAHILAPDDQWLYLPALKRVKRISSNNKSGPFLGSEFAYEDFTAQELNKFDYKYLRSEACGTLTCDVVERYPRYEKSGYTRQIVWIDQSHYQSRKVEYYDRKNGLLKTLTFGNYKLYQDKYWRAQELKMVNHQTNKSTDFIFDDYQFGLGLTDRDFAKGSLKRAR